MRVVELGVLRSSRISGIADLQEQGLGLRESGRRSRLDQWLRDLILMVVFVSVCVTFARVARYPKP